MRRVIFLQFLNCKSYGGVEVAGKHWSVSKGREKTSLLSGLGLFSFWAHTLWIKFRADSARAEEAHEQKWSQQLKAGASYLCTASAHKEVAAGLVGQGDARWSHCSAPLRKVLSQMSLTKVVSGAGWWSLPI